MHVAAVVASSLVENFPAWQSVQFKAPVVQNHTENDAIMSKAERCIARAQKGCVAGRRFRPKIRLACRQHAFAVLQAKRVSKLLYHIQGLDAKKP